MPYKLIVHTLPGKKIFEREYHQSLVSIGRDEMNDLLLGDTRHLVSRKHVEILEKNDGCWLTDLGSKNGSKLNKTSLVPGEEYQLKEGDRISIGTFSIDFMPTAPQHLDLSEVGPLTQNSKGQTATTERETNDLIAELNRSYCTHLEKTSAKRKGAMQEMLRRAVSKQSSEGASKLLAQLESHYLASNGEDRDVTGQPPLPEVVNAKPEVLNICKKAYDGLSKIATRYIDDCNALNTVEGIERFLDRLEKVVDMMFASLANALKSRRKFEQEFDVDATRLLAWRLNPIKECTTGKAIGKYLFDFKKPEAVDKVITDLEEGFNDLALHHLGLIAGLEESLKGILDQLNPELFELEGQKSTGGLMGLEPMRSRAAWKRYCEKYQKLREEEVKTFETILGPYIARGYLSVQKRKPPS